MDTNAEKLELYSDGSIQKTNIKEAEIDVKKYLDLKIVVAVLLILVLLGFFTIDHLNNYSEGFWYSPFAKLFIKDEKFTVIMHDDGNEAFYAGDIKDSFLYVSGKKVGQIIGDKISLLGKMFSKAEKADFRNVANKTWNSPRF